MGAGKSPARVTDGPYAAYSASDEIGTIAIPAGGTLVLGQPLFLDVTQLGPDNNIPNNGTALATAERLVAATSANAGPIFGIFLGFNAPTPIPRGFSVTVNSATNGGMPTYTNNTGATSIQSVDVRQIGWGYVWGGVAAAGGAAVNIGSVLITNATQNYAIAGAAAGLATVGTAIATAVNTSSPAAVVAGAGRVVTPVSMSGITTATALLIDSLAGGLQETVTPTAVTATTFTATFANGHAAGFAITGPNASQAKGTAIIANNASATGLVACFIEVQT